MIFAARDMSENQKGEKYVASAGKRDEQNLIKGRGKMKQKSKDDYHCSICRKILKRKSNSGKCSDCWRYVECPGCKGTKHKKSKLCMSCTWKGRKQKTKGGIKWRIF